MKKNIILLISFAFFLGSCLKEKERLEVADNTSRIVVQFKNGDTATLITDEHDPLNTLSLSPASGMVEVNAGEINTPSRSVMLNDVTVTVALNPALIDAYNLANNTSFEIPPPNVFQLVRTSYVLTLQNHSTQLRVNVNPALVLGHDYAVGVTITSTSEGEINPVKKDYIFKLSADNQYAGDYTSNGYFYHPTSPRAITNRPKTLQTFTSTSVICEVGDIGGLGYFAIFEVDASNNVTITAAPSSPPLPPFTMFTSGLPTSNPGYTPQWPGSAECNNTYDPVEQEFKVRYGYMGTTGWRVTEEIIKRD